MRQQTRANATSWWNVLVWSGVVVAHALWSVVSIMSLLELMNVYTSMSYAGWLAINWVVAGWSLVFAVTSCLLPMLGGVETCLGTISVEAAAKKRQPLKLHWIIYSLCTSLCATFMTQFYSHYTGSELRDLTYARQHPLNRPASMDLLVAVHWREVHLLNLVTWMVLLVTSFMLNLNHVILDGPAKMNPTTSRTGQ